MLPALLPLLGGFAGSSLAGAGALTGMSALTAGALGSGIGSLIATGDLGEGIKTGLMSFAGGKLLGGLMGSGAGAAGAEAAGAGAGNVGDVAAAAGNPATAVDTFQSITPPASAVTTSLPQYAPDPSGFTLGADKSLTPMTPDTTTMFGTAKDPSKIGFQFDTLAGKPGSSTLAKLGRAGMDFGGSAAGIGSSIGSSLAYTPPKPKEEAAPDIPQYGPDDSNVTFPTAITPSTGEFNYRFGQNFAGGGSLSRYVRPEMMGYGPIALAEGGLTSLAMDDMPTEDMDMSEDMMAMDMEEGSSGAPNDKEIIVDAVKAIKDGTSSEDNQIALAVFLQTFGEEALMDLVDSVQKGEFDNIADMNEGLIKGPGDAMDDLVPAKNQSNGEDILLSGEEFIVPGDVVSGLGNGSSEAGSEELYAMMDRVRQARTGTTEQPPQISAGGMLPA